MYLEQGRPKDDRLVGEKAEQLFVDFLIKKGRSATVTHGYAPDFDVWDDEFTYEVKFDRMHHQTGNFYIERKSLFNSKADYLVYLYEEFGLPGRLFISIAPSAKVRNWLRKQPGIKGGDFEEPGWLLSDTYFNSLFKTIGYSLTN